MQQKLEKLGDIISRVKNHNEHLTAVFKAVVFIFLIEQSNNSRKHIEANKRLKKCTFKIRAKRQQI